ncbi:ATPase, T2SS/T4P/T4SS family [Glaciimonas sp. CA11.2]|uniref:ATPase, T2SS/T4P/T4SS family n=1 Tax=unclassified Glaciimonas TaxID=2644401 RepID=UPI002AB502DE|nr:MULTISPECIES: ATPase, T2SS/T4P/T4SS family [unclassified Glaciimonas]MDY7547406.1 ATPase, T2SS/T4P/T4SS family [Glaciimonas sp. CA11.2]MEB0013579.1 ATPase, T2SS/T4P/T4SS family [Glaciimonas sp. Cout2]MEB0083220.1 ATPase, T2SS/T4P/T4SS family [Glaciimonas sp. Gout2]MEB0162993.1 ATPase, T2SS/T4P/T4SS family [Glaciimonas sp. CA11.2]
MADISGSFLLTVVSDGYDTLDEVAITKDKFIVGKADGSDLRLKGWSVSKLHATFLINEGSIFLEDSGSIFGTWIEGERINRLGPLNAGTEIRIGGYTLTLHVNRQGDTSASRRELDDPNEANNANARRALSANMHNNPPNHSTRPSATVDEISFDDDVLLADDLLDASAERVPRAQERAPQPVKAPSTAAFTPTVTARHESATSSNPPPILRPATKPERTERAEQPASSRPTSAGTQAPAVQARVIDHEFSRWRKTLHEAVLYEIDLRRIDANKMSEEDLKANVKTLIKELLASTFNVPDNIDTEQLTREVLDEAVGLGPLEPLIADESVTEIMVNRFDEIWVERGGRLELSAATFTSDLAVMGAIERIVTPLGRRIDESSPMVDARLKDGSRVNAIVPPLSLRGPTLTIRKFSRRKMIAEDLIKYGSMTDEMLHILRSAVEQRLNIVVSGGTGSGKTTFLNMMSAFVPNDERIVTIEDAAELQLSQPNLVSLESRPPNVEGKGHVAIRDLVRNSLRMRPDRIIVGECRGGEALDMLQAMNTGHDGSMTTLHANSPRDALARMEVLVLMAGMNLPVRAIREQISSAVHLIIQLTRYSCGARKVTAITEVVGIESETVQLQDVFKFHREGLDKNGKTCGEFRYSGMMPAFIERMNNE